MQDKLILWFPVEVSLDGLVEMLSKARFGEERHHVATIIQFDSPGSGRDANGRHWRKVHIELKDLANDSWEPIPYTHVSEPSKVKYL